MSACCRLSRPGGGVRGFTPLLVLSLSSPPHPLVLVLSPDPPSLTLTGGRGQDYTAHQGPFFKPLPPEVSKRQGHLLLYFSFLFSSAFLSPEASIELIMANKGASELSFMLHAVQHLQNKQQLVQNALKPRCSIQADLKNNQQGPIKTTQKEIWFKKKNFSTIRSSP